MKKKPCKFCEDLEGFLRFSVIGPEPDSDGNYMVFGCCLVTQTKNTKDAPDVRRSMSCSRTRKLRYCPSCGKRLSFKR